MAPQVGLEPTTTRLTALCFLVPLFSLFPLCPKNIDIMEGFFIMEILNFHYVHSFQFLICRITSQTHSIKTRSNPMSICKTIMCSCFLLKKNIINLCLIVNETDFIFIYHKLLFFNFIICRSNHIFIPEFNILRAFYFYLPAKAKHPTEKNMTHRYIYYCAKGSHIICKCLNIISKSVNNRIHNGIITYKFDLATHFLHLMSSISIPTTPYFCCSSFE